MGGGDGGKDADRYAEECEGERFSEDEPENILALGADGDANADFAGAARHGVGHQSIEADGCEQQRKAGEEAGKHRRDAFFDKLCVDGLRNRAFRPRR